MLRRNIITTIEFAKGKIGINTVEKLSANTVELFSAYDDVKNANAFLKKSIKEIEALIKGIIKDVFIIVEPSKTVDAKTKIVSEKVVVKSDYITKRDIDNLLELTAQKNYDPEREIILIQPLQYTVEGTEVKEYSVAPLNKQGAYLAANLAVTTINPEVKTFINKIVKNQSLNVIQIFMKDQVISQNNLSENALFSGSVLLHIADNNSFMTINKFHATVKTLSYYNAGYEKLELYISKEFNCSLEQAKQLISVYGTFIGGNNRVIFTNEDKVPAVAYTSDDLTTLIKNFLRRMLVLSEKYIEKQGVEHLPVVISGEITNIDGFEDYARQIFKGNLSIYQPFSYIEVNGANHSSMGVVQFNNRMDKKLGIQYNTIVETNPNPFSSLIKPKKSVWQKIIDKVGGRNYVSN